MEHIDTSYVATADLFAGSRLTTSYDAAGATAITSDERLASLLRSVACTVFAGCASVGLVYSEYAIPEKQSAPSTLTSRCEVILRGMLAGLPRFGTSSMTKSSSDLSTGITEDELHLSAYRVERATKMLDNIYQLISEGNADQSLVAIYDAVCGLLAEGQVTECDVLLSRVDSTKVDSDALLSFLMATATIPRESLPNRSRLYSEAVALFTSEMGQESAQRLLRRYA